MAAPLNAPSNAPGNVPLAVPRLAAGDRLVLRAWELGDLSVVREASRDDYIPLITTVPVPYSQSAGEAFVRRQWERAAGGSGYPFVIERVEDGRPLGTVGLWARDRGEGRATLGYWLAGAARGRGGRGGSRRGGGPLGVVGAGGSPPPAVRRAVERGVAADR